MDMAKSKRKSTFEAISLLVGIVVGAGILGIPYVVAQVGLAIGIFYIIGAGILFTFLNLMMGETVARTHKPLQIVGLSKRYLGLWGKRVSVLILFMNAYGGMLAYTIGQGEVLSAIFGRTPFFWSIVFFAIASLILASNIKSIATFEFLFTLSIFAIVMIIASVSFSNIQLENVMTFNWSNIFIPFGVMLFAYAGATAIPQMEELLPNDHRLLRRSIIIGSLIPMFLYLIFAITVVGVTGLNTTEVATVGLGVEIGQWMVMIGNVFAFIAMITSFVMAGLILKRSFQWDGNIPTKFAWFATVVPPITLFLVGARSFIAVINIAGAVLGGIMTILIVTAFWKAKKLGDVESKVFNMPFGVAIGIIIIVIFMIGSTYSVLSMIG